MSVKASAADFVLSGKNGRGREVALEFRGLSVSRNGGPSKRVFRTAAEAKRVIEALRAADDSRRDIVRRYRERRPVSAVVLARIATGEQVSMASRNPIDCHKIGPDGEAMTDMAGRFDEFLDARDTFFNTMHANIWDFYIAQQDFISAAMRWTRRIGPVALAYEDYKSAGC